MRRLNIKIKLIPFFVLLVCISIPEIVYAETPEESEKRMDEIKLNASYVYGESFNADEDIAYGNSLTDLTIYCNEIRGERGLEQLKSSDLQPVSEEIRSFKNGQHTIFLYISVEDMLKMQSKSRAAVAVNNPQLQSQSQDPPRQSSSVRPSVSQSQNDGGSLNEDRTENVRTLLPQSLPTEILESLTIQNTWNELKPMIIRYKELGKISKTGNTQQWDAVPDDAYAILLDADAGVLAFLSPLHNSERLNYKTNRVDSVVNYSNCKFIVWYK